MADYQKHNVPGSPDTPWNLTGKTLVSVTPDVVVFNNADGTQTHLNGWEFAHDPVADTLTGLVHTLTRTDASGTTVYETLRYSLYALVDASAFYSDTVNAADLLFGSPGNDVLNGGGGTDFLSGGDGDDLLDGGAGRDDMIGGAGDDTYVLRPGDGTSDFLVTEIISEGIGEGFDTIRIEGIAPWRVTVSFHADNGTFRLGIPDSNGQILYTDIVTRSGSDVGTDIGKRIERIVFDGGTVWDLTGPLTLTGTNLLFGSEYGDNLQVVGPSNTVYAATGNDIVRGGWGRDEIDGGEGDDLLEGGDGNDTLHGGRGPNPGNDTLRGGNGDDGLYAGGSGQNHLDGGAGKDVLVGGDGADVLVGGTGGDKLAGGGGDDVYILRAGDGGAGTYEDHDEIFENRNRGVDTIHLEDLTPADVKLMMSPLSGGMLRLEMKASDGSASYVDFQGGEVTPTSHSSEVELITFADGTVWDLRQGLPPLDDYGPIAGNDTYTVEAGQTIIVDAAHGVLANDSDPDGDPLTLNWRNGPSDGTMVKNADGSFQYTPNAGFTGEDTTLYRIEADGLFDSGQVTFIVTPPQPDAPVASDDSGFTTAAQTPLTIAAADLLANDTDADGDALSITAVSDAVGGAVALDVSGNPVFTPNAGFSGPASFRYTVSDGGLTATAQVQLTVEQGGNSGDDILSGGVGDDVLDGGAGEDRLSGGNGLDRLNGGTGNDVLSGGNGADQLFGDSGDDALDGGNGEDVMEGGSGNDGLSAGNGADRLAGGVGDDVLSGGNGDDQLEGGDGADSLSGGNGADRLAGGAGADILTGGNGGDMFVFKAGFGSDVITDLRLSGASQDRIAFEDGIFDSMADMLSHAADTAGGVLIATDAADALLIRNTTAAQLAANPEDFFFA